MAVNLTQNELKTFGGIMSYTFLSKRIYLLVIIIILASTVAMSQINIILEQPPLNQIKTEDLWNLTLINTSNQAYSIVLNGTVIKDDEGKIFDATTSKIELPPGSKRIRLKDMGTIKTNFANKKYEEMLVRTGTVPEGNYEICVAAISSEDELELGETCISQNIMHLTPPELLSPENGKEISETEAASIVFQWMPPSPAPPSGFSYTLKIVEIMLGQSPGGALQNNPVFFSRDRITATNFAYPLSAPKLIGGKSYVWQIFLKDKSDNPIGLPSHGAVFIVLAPEKEEQITALKRQPKLISPQMGEICKTNAPEFVWTTPEYFTEDEKVSYNFYLYLSDQQAQPEKRKENIIFKANNLTDTTLLLPPDIVPLRHGFYIWTVEAVINGSVYDPEGDFEIPEYNQIDYGDLSDPPYKTLAASNGAAHYWAVDGVTIPEEEQAWLGPFDPAYSFTVPLPPPAASINNPLQAISFEADALIASAICVDGLDTKDDGVFFPGNIHNCCSGNTIQEIDVLVQVKTKYRTNNPDKPLYLAAWIDWNNDGFSPLPGYINELTTWLSAVPVMVTGNTTVAPEIPTGYYDSKFIKINPSTWSNTWAIYRLRFRCNPLTGVSCLPIRVRLFVGETDINKVHSFYQLARSGEVEDYIIVCDTSQQEQKYDFGDAPDETINPALHYCSHKLPGRISPAPWTAFDGAKHENFSFEWLGNINDHCRCLAVASADAELDANTIDLDLFDDGIDFSSFIYPFTNCQTQTIRVKVSTTGNPTRYIGKPLFLHAWFDWNQDGDWDDTFRCGIVPADEHVYWLTAQAECSGGASMPVNDYGFKIDPTTWSGWHSRTCEVYKLTFHAAMPAQQNAATDTLWCRFRLSYDDAGTGTANPNVASSYYGEVPFGEVEDYALSAVGQEEECQCSIDKIYVGDVTINSSGDAAAVPEGSTVTISIVGNCGACIVSSYDWTITKPDGSSDTRTGISFSYSFGTTGRYTFEAEVQCPDGSVCSWIFYVDVSSGSSGGNPCTQFEISSVEITYPEDGITRSITWTDIIYSSSGFQIIRYSEELSMDDIPIRGRFIVDREPGCEVINTQWSTQLLYGGCAHGGSGTEFEIPAYCMSALESDGRIFRVKLKKTCSDYGECEKSFMIKVVPSDWDSESPEK